MRCEWGRPRWSATAKLIACLLVFFVFVLPANAYSVLTHEELVDLVWDDSIRPLLLSRYPQTTPEELREAHAYAYGGSVLQDMGYYPFGNHLLSDLTHYARTGDFEKNLFLQSTNAMNWPLRRGRCALRFRHPRPSFYQPVHANRVS